MGTMSLGALKEDLKRELKASYVREPFTITLNFEDLKGGLKGIIFLGWVRFSKGDWGVLV